MKDVQTASLSLFICAIVLLLGIAEPSMSKTETPHYTIIAAPHDGIEIRRYAPMIIAQVELQTSPGAARRAGFRVLADYIFGNNTLAQDIDMTAPVTQQNSAKIAMTAPVQQQGSGEAWKISFVMPAKYNMDTLPRPNNPQVKIRAIPAQKFITLRFSGRSISANIQKHEAQLMDYVKAHNIAVKGVPKYAFYSPPWTLPAFRRNEVMLEMAQ